SALHKSVTTGQVPSRARQSPTDIPSPTPTLEPRRKCHAEKTPGRSDNRGEERARNETAGETETPYARRLRCRRPRLAARKNPELREAHKTRARLDTERAAQGVAMRFSRKEANARFLPWMCYKR